MGTDTALDAVETGTEGGVLLQPGAASLSSERGHQHPWEVPQLNNEGTKPTGREYGSGNLGSIPACVWLIPVRESRLLITLWIQGQADVQSRQNNPTLHPSFKIWWQGQSPLLWLSCPVFLMDFHPLRVGIDVRCTACPLYLTSTLIHTL